MLTASLQSTWAEGQRSRKGAAARGYGSAYDDSEPTGVGGYNLNERSISSKPIYGGAYGGGGGKGGDGLSGADLSNLKIPQISVGRAGGLGNAGQSGNSSPRGLGGTNGGAGGANGGLSSGPTRDMLSVGVSRKYRGNSRQTGGGHGHRVGRRQKYGDAYGGGPSSSAHLLEAGSANGLGANNAQIMPLSHSNAYSLNSNSSGLNGTIAGGGGGAGGKGGNFLVPLLPSSNGGGGAGGAGGGGGGAGDGHMLPQIGGVGSGLGKKIGGANPYGAYGLQAQAAAVQAQAQAQAHQQAAQLAQLQSHRNHAQAAQLAAQLQATSLSAHPHSALLGTHHASGSGGGSHFSPQASSSLLGGGSGSGAGSSTYQSSGGVTTEELALSGVASIKGLKPGNPNWTNQDNFFMLEGAAAGGDAAGAKGLRMYCVLDGHGEHGHLVSRRCRESFPGLIKSSGFDMDHAFQVMQSELTSSEMDVKCSGATCVLAVLANGKLSVYNCGDSRAVLGRRNPNGSITAHALSNDHKPDRPEERKRILACGGHLGCRQVLVNQGRGPVSMPVGPCRVWYQHRGETLGLAMSRSLGDAIVHKCGVSAEPELLEHAVDDYDEFFILATDGVWDVVDNNHAVQMVHNFAVRSINWNPLEAASCVCKFARSRWEKLSPMVDDITCIVIKL